MQPQDRRGIIKGGKSEWWKRSVFFACSFQPWYFSRQFPCWNSNRKLCTRKASASSQSCMAQNSGHTCSPQVWIPYAYGGEVCGPTFICTNSVIKLFWIFSNQFSLHSWGLSLESASVYQCNYFWKVQSGAHLMRLGRMINQVLEHLGWESSEYVSDMISFSKMPLLWEVAHCEGHNQSCSHLHIEASIPPWSLHSLSVHFDSSALSAS